MEAVVYAPADTIEVLGMWAEWGKLMPIDSLTDEGVVVKDKGRIVASGFFYETPSRLTYIDSVAYRRNLSKSEVEPIMSCLVEGMIKRAQEKKYKTVVAELLPSATLRQAAIQGGLEPQYKVMLYKGEING